MSNPVIALTDQGFVERITALALTEHRTNAATLRLLVQLGLNSYDLTGSIVCPGRVRCTRPNCFCHDSQPTEGSGYVLPFPVLRPEA
jgi:hypothetical protein